jgi:hypothetical protein
MQPLQQGWSAGIALQHLRVLRGLTGTVAGGLIVWIDKEMNNSVKDCFTQRRISRTAAGKDNQ